jgi:hypothetical protein
MVVVMVVMMLPMAVAMIVVVMVVMAVDHLPVFLVDWRISENITQLLAYEEISAPATYFS